MSDLIVTEFVSLDGVMEAPGGEPTHPHAGWAIAYSTGDEHVRVQVRGERSTPTRSLIGRVTYESFAGAWPHLRGRRSPTR